MILKTERLILRPWEESDADALYEYAKDPDVGPPAGWNPHQSPEDSLGIIRTVFSNKETYAICRKEDNIPIGSAALLLNGNTDVTDRDDECELGYWIGKPFWGLGYVPEASRELLRRCFSELGMRAVWCGYYDGNTKSKRVQEKVGFKYHHTDYNVSVPLLNETRTSHINLLTKEDWKNSFSIRRLNENEIPAALSLAWRVFSEYEAPVYSPEGTEEFRRCLNDEKYLSGIEYYGAFDLNTLIGEIGIRKDTCHICFFFVDCRYHRTGIGTSLFNTIKRNYPDNTISLNSSPYGVPFYRQLGFIPSDDEQTVNGIRFTPMFLKTELPKRSIVTLSQRRDLKAKAASWFSSKWKVPYDAYLDSIESSFSSSVPSWYLCLEDENIIAGMGVIENDFHDRKDLSPNICAVFTEPAYRCQGIAGKMLDYVCTDMNSKGIDTLYLITDHTGFYERYGWEFLCTAISDGEDSPSRIYVHHQKS